MQGDRLKVTPATAAERAAIYRLRHEVYAKELGQHRENAGGALQDALDDANEYIVVTDARSREFGGIAGFVSITPPGRGRYSLDKYLDRSELPFAADENLFEVRRLTVCAGHRGSAVTPLLLYAALRFVEEHGGTRIAAIGRRELMPLYSRIGLRPLGRSFARSPQARSPTN